jgi:hypothetical protein
MARIINATTPGFMHIIYSSLWPGFLKVVVFHTATGAKLLQIAPDLFAPPVSSDATTT